MEYNASGSFILGVTNIQPVEESDDLYVTGRVVGTAYNSDVVRAIYLGDNEVEECPAEIIGIETRNGLNKQTKNEEAKLLIKDGRMYGIRRGSVLCTPDREDKEVFETYTKLIGDIYVMGGNFEFTDEELAALTFTDLAEAWRLHAWLKQQIGKKAPAQEEKEQIQRIGEALCKKILAADSIYCAFDKNTGEPHMFSQTIDKKNGSYMCTPPNIFLMNAAFAEHRKKYFPNEKIEYRRIDNGEDGKGILNFLGSCFYLNGACGVMAANEKVTVAAPMLVPKPDYSSVENKAAIPVTNPELERWILMLGQIGKPETEQQKLVHRLYFTFMRRELPKAKLIIPMKNPEKGSMSEPDEHGKAQIKAGTQLQIATMKGRDERMAVRMFTDWKRFRAAFESEGGWGGLIQTIGGMISTFDCAINLTQYPMASCYVSRELFEEAVKAAEKTEEKPEEKTV